jgi:hypothetical protein
MKTIFIRSPYFIEVNEENQLGSKVELFIWNKYEFEPATANYTLSKTAASPIQSKNIYNISNYVKEYIDIINPVLINAIDEENINNWCYVKVKRYTSTEIIGEYDLLDTTTYIALNGYTNYLDGYNNLIDADEVILTSLQENKKHKYYVGAERSSGSEYINFLIGISDNEYKYRISVLSGSGSAITTTIINRPEEEFLLKIPTIKPSVERFANGNIFEILKDDEVIFSTIFILECETKYEPLQCSYINRLGGWDFITFFKARTQNWEVKNKEYQLLPNDIDYNPLRGESKAFNYEAKQTIKINTGWVDENYNELIKDLMTSETILLDNKPVKLKTMTTDLKTSLQDKMINYQIDFEYNYNQINNVI